MTLHAVHTRQMPKKPPAPSWDKLLLQPRILLPVMIFAGVLTIGLRVEDVWTSVSQNTRFYAVTVSQASPAEAKEEAHAAKSEKAAAKTEATKEEADPDFHATRKADHDEDEANIDPSIIKQLKDRRATLEVKAQELDAREAIIKVAETRLDQKMKEMENLRTQLQTLINNASAGQQAQLDNLVKIYETMKAKEAAKIFETMDMPTLLGVVEKMKPARVAVIMAEMAPEKAKDITVALTKKDQLPTLK